MFNSHFVDLLQEEYENGTLKDLIEKHADLSDADDFDVICDAQSAISDILDTISFTDIPRKELQEFEMTLEMTDNKLYELFSYILNLM